MKFTPGDYRRTVDQYEVQDGGWALRIGNECGDIVAMVRRPDGSQGKAYGGPVYPYSGFKNLREDPDEWSIQQWRRARPGEPYPTSTKHDMTDREKAMAEAMARKVGWMQ